MYGLIGRMIAAPGRRDELVRAMLDASAAMPGCLSYIVARDPQDENAIWVTEVWDSRESHAASLGIPAVKATIERAMPLIDSFAQQTETEPVGGVGIPLSPERGGSS